MNVQFSSPRQVFGPDPTKAYGGLTAQQYDYCELRASGLGKSESYRQAYDSDLKGEALMRLAWSLEDKPHIANTINQMVSAHRSETTLVPKVTKNFVLEGITAIAVKTEAKDNVRLRAYELLGKAVGLFKDEAPAPDKPRTIEEIDAELRERLSAMRTIEGTATRQPPEQPAQTTGDRRRKPKT